jgi:hypothetical protein
MFQARGCSEAQSNYKKKIRQKPEFTRVPVYPGSRESWATYYKKLAERKKLHTVNKLSLLYSK